MKIHTIPSYFLLTAGSLSSRGRAPFTFAVRRVGASSRRAGGSDEGDGGSHAAFGLRHRPQTYPTTQRPPKQHSAATTET